jgi:hypothetical protein
VPCGSIRLPPYLTRIKSHRLTQDIEDPTFIAPEVDPNRTTPAQCGDIRACLKMAGKTEDEILDFYGVGKLEVIRPLVVL